MTPLGWLGRKTSTQTNMIFNSYSVFLWQEKKPAGAAKNFFVDSQKSCIYNHKALPKNIYKVRSLQIDKLMISTVHCNGSEISGDPQNYHKRTNDIPLAMHMPENENWYVLKKRKLISCKRINNKRHVLVQWVWNYPNTYEPEEHLSKYLIKQYYVNKSKLQKKIGCR